LVVGQAVAAAQAQEEAMEEVLLVVEWVGMRLRSSVSDPRG
jgi:hypothetical protein